MWVSSFHLRTYARYTNAMELFLFVEQYFLWHYSRALREIIGITENFVWFLYNFFSIPVLVKTFFSPWRRMQETYRKGFYLGDFFSSLAINTIMRIVGVIIRTATIVVGCVAIIAVLLAGVIFFAIWLVLPAVILLFIYQGIIEFIA